MAEDPQFASRPDSKRKYDDQTPPPSVRRATGFSAPIASPSPDSHTNTAAPLSYNSVPPPADEIQLAKQRAQEIAARLFNSAEAKRPRVENGGAEDDKGFSSDFVQKPPSQQTFHSQAVLAPPASTYGFQGTSKKIDIPNGRVGVIIGKGGETIKYLQLQSGAKIQVTRDMDADPNSPSRLVELMGTPEQISKAEQLINDVLAEAESGGSGIVASRRFGPGQMGTEQFIMKVPNNKVGLIIGKGGETIKNMQARSGARIQLIPLHLPPGDTSTERTVQIDGTPEQIEAAKELINEVVSENRARNPPMSGAYPQQGYRPPRPPTNWGPPGPPTQQPGYGYMQPGAYTGPSQYNASQPPYGGYPPQSASGGYSAGWDQSSAPPSQQTTPGSGYDYYNQQPPPQQPSSTVGSSTPGDGSSYNYSQPPAANYGSQGSYGDTQYSHPPVGQQGGYGQEGYSSTGGYHAPTSQQGYGQQQPTSQSGFEQAQAYSSAPGYPNVNNPNQDPPASYGAPTGSTQTPPQQVPPSVQPPTAAQQGGYTGQPPTTTPPSYSSQGAIAQPGYGMPPSSQSPYANQAPGQTGYSQSGSVTQTGYGQPPQGQKPGPTTQPVYGQGPQQIPPTTQGGYMAPVQPGYPHSQISPAQSGYGQQDPALHRTLPSGYGPAAPQASYGLQQTYGAPASVSQPGYGQQQQQPPPSQQYADSYATSGGGYPQPPVYSADSAASGNTHGAYDAPPGAQPGQGVVAKTSPQT
ncbi:uncharacterized protein [Aristolochia californica]|uniref:uncharacterized protein n=1 Tax=Aristolochia californica TaxID=171875 RepID=UPI0035D9CD98